MTTPPTLRHVLDLIFVCALYADSIGQPLPTEDTDKDRWRTAWLEMKQAREDLRRRAAETAEEETALTSSSTTTAVDVSTSSEIAESSQPNVDAPEQTQPSRSDVDGATVRNLNSALSESTRVELIELILNHGGSRVGPIRDDELNLWTDVVADREGRRWGRKFFEPQDPGLVTPVMGPFQLLPDPGDRIFAQHRNLDALKRYWRGEMSFDELPRVASSKALAKDANPLAALAGGIGEAKQIVERALKRPL